MKVAGLNPAPIPVIKLKTQAERSVVFIHLRCDYDYIQEKVKKL